MASSLCLLGNQMVRSTQEHLRGQEQALHLDKVTRIMSSRRFAPRFPETSKHVRKQTLKCTDECGTRALSLERGSLLDVLLRLQKVRTGLWEQAIARLKVLDIEKDATELEPVLTAIEERLSSYVAATKTGRKTKLYVSQLTREHLRKTMAFFLAMREDQDPVPFQQAGTGTLNTLVLALLSFIAELKPDSVICATGYRRGLETLVGHLGVLRPDGVPFAHRGAPEHPSAPGLYFAGMWGQFSGQIRLGPIHARRILRAAGRRRASATCRHASAPLATLDG